MSGYESGTRKIDGFNLVHFTPQIAILAGFLGPTRTFDPIVPRVCIRGLRVVTNIQEQPLGFQMNFITALQPQNSPWTTKNCFVSR